MGIRRRREHSAQPGISDARARIEEWMTDYNQNRPHSSLGSLTPGEFADQLKTV